ncbi:GNAT family N-acetyltransferase [Musicola keenii]|uniref:GNAT family N-acetyltransferase n=1 Tax=Musicola keenii TaxID=2884250 RepID=UPI00177D2A62|nr:GNAT family N-acetyltransferase [Musicola keenii]
MALNIRKAHLADSVLLHKLGFEIYSTHFKHLWVSHSEMNDYLEREYSTPILASNLTDPNVCWYLAETDHPVGFAKVTWADKIPDTEMSGVLLNKLYLASSATGQHYGKQLFEYIVSLAQQRGEGFLWLEVLEGNARARKFYENLGFGYIKDTKLQTASQQSLLHILGMNI